MYLNSLKFLLGTVYLLSGVAEAGPLGAGMPDTWSHTFPFIWVLNLFFYGGPAALGIIFATVVQMRKRKGISFGLVLREIIVSLVGLLLLYTAILAVLFALYKH